MSVAAQARGLKARWPELANAEIARGLHITAAAVTFALRARTQVHAPVPGIDPTWSTEQVRAWLARQSKAPIANEQRLALDPDRLRRTRSAASHVGMSLENYVAHVLDQANTQVMNGLVVGGTDATSERRDRDPCR